MISNSGKVKNINNQNRIPYKIDTGTAGNIMPIYIFRILFPMVTKEQLTAIKIKALS